MDDPAALLARALRLDDDAEELRRAAAHLTAVAEETPGLLAAPQAGLTVEIWDGQAARQAREALAARHRSAQDIAAGLHAAAAELRRQANHLQAQADDLRILGRRLLAEA